MKKILLLTILLTILALPAFSIGFGYHILEVRTEPEFANGTFPSSMKYQFNFPVPDFIGGNITELTFRLDNGLIYRSLDQDPVTGKYYSKYPELLASAGFEEGQRRDYSVQFDEFALIFSQGILKTPLSDKDLFRIEASFGGRFENAFERLFFMYNEDNTSGVFNSSYNVPRFPSEVWNAYPELAKKDDGLRSTLTTFLNCGLDINLLRDEIVKKNGIKLSAEYRYSPKSLPLSDGKADFNRLTVKLEGALTLFTIKQSNGYSWCSTVIGVDVTYRNIKGSIVPAYATSGEIFGIIPPRTEQNIYGRLYLTIFGPQIKAKDLYPFITIFNDFALSKGRVINSQVDEVIKEYALSYGIKAELVIYNFANIFYEIGYVYKNVFNNSPYQVQAKFGITVGV